MAIVLTFNDKLAAIVDEIEKLSPREQHLLLIRLQEKELLDTAKKLAKGVKQGKKMSDEQVADLVRNNRKKWKKTS